MAAAEEKATPRFSSAEDVSGGAGGGKGGGVGAAAGWAAEDAAGSHGGAKAMNAGVLIRPVDDLPDPPAKPSTKGKRNGSSQAIGLLFCFMQCFYSYVEGGNVIGSLFFWVSVAYVVAVRQWVAEADIALLSRSEGMKSKWMTASRETWSELFGGRSRFLPQDWSNLCSVDRF